MGRRNGGNSTRTILLTLVILTTLVLIGLTAAAAFLGPSMVLAYQVSALDAHAAEFLAPPASTADKDVQPYLNRKLIILDPKKGHIDPFWRQLPEEMVARNRDEVGTVVWVDWEEDGAVGRAAGEVQVPVTKLTLIDREHNQVLGERHFNWEFDPGQAHKTTIAARPPAIAVADYLKSLPRR